MDLVDQARAFQDLLRSIAGKDMYVLPDRSYHALCTAAFEAFREATRFLSEFASVLDATSSCHASRPEVESRVWIGRFEMRPAEQLEAALGRSQVMQQAASVFYDMCLTVDLIGAGGEIGNKHGPELIVSLQVCGDPAMELLGAVIAESENTGHPLMRDCTDFCLYSCETRAVDIPRPSRVAPAYASAAKAIRVMAADPDHHGFVEPLALEFIMTADQNPQAAGSWLADVFSLYLALAKTLNAMYHNPAGGH